MARGCALIDSRLDTAKIGSDGRVEVHRARLLAVFGGTKNVSTRPGPIADNRLPLGGDAPPAAKAIVDLTQWAKPGGEGGSGTDRGATQRGRGTGRRIGRANECANEEDGAPREVTARRAPPIAAICFQAVGRGPPPIRSAPPAAMPRHCHRGT